MDSNTPENQQQPAKKDKFDPKKPPDKSNPEEVYNYVAKRISGPTFRNPLKNFIDENCITFIDVDENTFEQGQLFKELNQLLENLLDDVLKDGQLTQEDFLKAAERGIEDKQYKKYFNQVINFGDYTFFKSIMTKRNYQIIKMAEQQMTNAKNMAEEKKEEVQVQAFNNEENEQKTKELVKKLLEEENKELDEAIKQSLEEEDKRRRIAAIEEEELRRALQKSLMSQEEKEPPKKEEPEIKKEVKKEEPKKFVPSISNQINFGFEGQVKPKEEEKKPEIKPDIKKEEEMLPSSQKGFILESSNANINVEHHPNPYNPYNNPNKKVNPYKKNEQKPKSPKKEEEIIPKEEPKEEIKPKEEFKPKKEENENIINEEEKPKKEERITREFVNVFEEKKKTLKPLANKHNIRNDNEGKKGTLLQDLKKKKGNIKEDIERLNIKKENQKKIESASEIIKNQMQKEVKEDNNNDIVNLDDGLLINDDNEEEDKNKYVSKHNIQFGKIEIPNNFNGKIPDYTKEKQEELKEFREMVIKHKINDRQNDENDD